MPIEKAKMPKGGVKVSVPIVLHLSLLHDFDKYSNGNMLMKFADTSMRVMDGDEQIGELGTAIGGGIYLQFGKAEWSVDAMRLWQDVHAGLVKPSAQAVKP